MCQGNGIQHITASSKTSKSKGSVRGFWSSHKQASSVHLNMSAIESYVIAFPHLKMYSE